MNWNSAKSNEKEPSVDVLQRHIMEQCVSIVVIKVQKCLPGVLQEWITKHLTENNLAEIPSIYEKTLNEQVMENKTTVNPGLWEEFPKLCEKESRELCKLPLEVVSEVSHKFNRMISEAFVAFGCFPDEAQLEIIGINKMKSLSKHIDADFVLPATKLVSEKLMKIYKQRNQTILTSHSVKIQTVNNSLKQLYTEEIEVHLKNGPMRQSLLQKFHSDIEEKCLEMFEQAFTDTGKTIGKIRDDGRARLRQQLEAEFSVFQRVNATRLVNWIRLTERNIEQIATECKAEIEDFGKLTNQKLTQAHVHQVYQITAKLKEGMDLTYKLLTRADNPVKSLNTDWLDLQSSFEKNWREKLSGGEQLSAKQFREKIQEALLITNEDEMMDVTKMNYRERIALWYNNFPRECLKICGKILPNGLMWL